MMVGPIGAFLAEHPPELRDEAALHRINTTYYPFYRIGNEGEQLSPVANLIAA